MSFSSFVSSLFQTTPGKLLATNLSSEFGPLDLLHLARQLKKNYPGNQEDLLTKVDKIYQGILKDIVNNKKPEGLSYVRPEDLSYVKDLLNSQSTNLDDAINHLETQLCGYSSPNLLAENNLLSLTVILKIKRFIQKNSAQIKLLQTKTTKHFDDSQQKDLNDVLQFLAKNHLDEPTSSSTAPTKIEEADLEGIIKEFDALVKEPKGPKPTTITPLTKNQIDELKKANDAFYPL